MAKELNEDTGFNISIKTLIAIGFAMATIIGLCFDLKEDIPCPDPSKNNPRIGDVAASGKEKVSGFELINGTCVVIYEPVTAVEKYLPQVGTVSTTAIIASTAVVSSVLAKPLADLIVKIIKPSIKKIIDGLKKKILKKEPKKVSAFEHRMAQRERNRAFRKLKKGW